MTSTSSTSNRVEKWLVVTLDAITRASDRQLLQKYRELVVAVPFREPAVMAAYARLEAIRPDTLRGIVADLLEDGKLAHETKVQLVQFVLVSSQLVVRGFNM